MKILLILSLTLTSACFAQVELMQNNWPTDPLGYNFYPDLSVTYASRAKTNTGAGIPGVPYKYTFKQYAGWGYHTHETANGCCTITRPDPVWILAMGGGQTTDGQKRLIGVTDAGGYANGNLMFNGYAGAYTVCIEFYGNPNNPGLMTYQSCVNNVTRYSTGSNPRAFLQRYPGGLSPYPQYPGEVNYPQTLHWDRRHVCANTICPAGGTEASTLNSDGYTGRWGTAATNAALLLASTQYKQDSLIAGQQDWLDITSISLPDGGIRDNDAQGVTPGIGPPLNSSGLDWETRVMEEHARGVEVDIVVANTNLQSTQFVALYTANCKPGIRTPDDGALPDPPDPYWKSQGVVHVNCIPTNGPTKGGVRAR